MAGRRLGERDYRMLAEFRYALRRFLRVSEEAARAEGIEPQQHQLLLFIRGAAKQSDVTVGYLAERMQLRHHTVVELLNRVVAKGLVRREQSTEDRRVVFVEITSAGKATLERISQQTFPAISELAPELVDVLSQLAGGESGSPEPAAVSTGRS
jgi:DNA-binding MarR family transcriptional regulator